MAAKPPPLALAHCDGAGHFVDAAEPLAGLQLRCGGTLPGAIAIPMLAEMVAQAQHYDMKLARAMAAEDGEHAITAWVEVAPGAATALTQITLHSWQASPLPAEDPSAVSHRRSDIDRALAELTARLDAAQAVLTAESAAPDLLSLAHAMQAGHGKPWTDFVHLPGNAHQQPMHWRLLDGAEVAVQGSRRVWRAALIPLGRPGAEPDGFELYLTSSTPPPVAAAPAQSEPIRAVVGREIAPVLRQPIARIIANAETIRSKLAGPLGEEYSRYAGDIATAGQHLLELVDDLADLEVVEDGNFTTAPDAIDLADVARRAAGILSMRARERAITLVPPPPEASLPAIAEFRRVLQVLLNLIGNAIRYAPEGSRVEMLLEAKLGRALITIADEGAGLTPEQSAKVFEKFERLGRSGDGGTGLGLYISRRLARAMRGDLTVTSQPGHGARFTLEVPGRL